MAADRAFDDLVRKAHGVAERTRDLIQLPATATDALRPAESAEALRDLAGQLRAKLRGPILRDADRAAQVCELLAELTELRQELREYMIGVRFRSLARIHAALAELRELSTADKLIESAPEALCRCCDFDRAVISHVRDAMWIPEAVFLADGQDPVVADATRRYLNGAEIPLSPLLLETELARRGAPGLVKDAQNDPRTFKELMTAVRTQSYVAAPIMPAGRAIGLLHADAFGSGRELTTIDRDNLWTFAEGFGSILERVVLVERLAEQRSRVRSAFRKAEAFIGEVKDSDVRLVRQERASSAVTTRTASMFLPTESRISALLTSRECEVLELMARGARNKQIADRLVISEATVKSHVKNVCRKLHASTRSEAVSRYLRLAMRERPQ